MKLVSTPKLVTIFGGSGFVGRYVVQSLAREGYQIRVAVRRPDLAGHLQILGNVGQIQLVQANLRYSKSVKAAVTGADAVINLVGIMRQSGKQHFDTVQGEGGKEVTLAAKREGARLIHMSAIGADINSTSLYNQSKGQAEKHVRAHFKDAIILRSSVIFGAEDEFFNRFGAMSQHSPFLPLIGGGTTKLQPVYVKDVAKMFVKAVEGSLEGGKTYELGGPEQKTLRECMEMVIAVTGRQRSLVSIPWIFASIMAKLTGWLPFAPLTSDQVVLLKSDNVVSAKATKDGLTLEGQGIQPTPLALILPTFMVKYREHGQFTKISDTEA